MQQLLFVCFLLLTASLLRAGDLPRLNLEVGKKYTIETIYHEDTSKVNPHREYDKKIFEFTPTGFDKDKGIYDVKLVITYFMHVVQEIPQPGIWMERDVYETGYPSNFRRPVVFMNKHLVPVTFKLSKDGEITSFDFSAYYNYKKLGDLEPDLGELDQKEMEVEISGIFFKADKIRAPWFGSVKLFSGYSIINENETSVEVKVDSIRETNSVEQFKRTVLIDKSTGMILEDKLSYLWIIRSKISITRYQKLIPLLSEKSTVFQKTPGKGYEINDIQYPNTILRIRNHDNSVGRKLIYLTYYDLNSDYFKSIRLEKDQKGFFDFQLHLDHSQGFYINLHSESLRFSGIYDLSLYPGDNLEIEINESSDSIELKYSGTGAVENRVGQQIYKLIGPVIPVENSQSVQTLKVKMETAFRILNEQKLILNPEVYLELANTMLYDPRLIRNDLDIDFLDYLKIPVYNTIAARNPFYLRFLKQYVAVSLEKIRQSSSNLKGSNYNFERDYSYGQVLFPEPILTEYQSMKVEDAIRSGNWASATMLYERHKLAYSTNPRFLKTKHIYELQSQFSPGSRFPIDELTDILGNTIRFRENTDKILIIRHHQIRNQDNLAKDMAELKNFTVHQKEVLNVWLFIGISNQLSSVRTLADSLPGTCIVFINTDEFFQQGNVLQPLMYKGAIVLGRKGIILFNRDPNPGELQIAIEDLKKPPISYKLSDSIVKIIAIALLIILITGGFGFIVYRQVSRRQLKRAELSRRMRELELTVIRTQMNPHFMYNCLNSIQNLVQKNQNDEAHLYLSKFASLVRQVLNNSKKEEIPLSKELDSVQEYIELEQLRFDFGFKLEVAEGVDLNAIFVPPMLLQPFVENAILHGLLLKKSDRLLVIRIVKEHAKITLVVEDNGVGREVAGNSDQKGNGQGILLCRNRLSLLSEKTGIHYELTIDDLTDDNLQPTGTRISIGFVEED